MSDKVCTAFIILLYSSLLYALNAMESISCIDKGGNKGVGEWRSNKNSIPQNSIEYKMLEELLTLAQ